MSDTGSTGKADIHAEGGSRTFFKVALAGETFIEYCIRHGASTRSRNAAVGSTIAALALMADRGDLPRLATGSSLFGPGVAAAIISAMRSGQGGGAESGDYRSRAALGIDATTDKLRLLAHYLRDTESMIRVISLVASSAGVDAAEASAVTELLMNIFVNREEGTGGGDSEEKVAISGVSTTGACAGGLEAGDDASPGVKQTIRINTDSTLLAELTYALNKCKGVLADEIEPGSMDEEMLELVRELSCGESITEGDIRSSWESVPNPHILGELGGACSPMVLHKVRVAEALARNSPAVPIDGTADNGEVRLGKLIAHFYKKLTGKSLKNLARDSMKSSVGGEGVVTMEYLARALVRSKYYRNPGCVLAALMSNLFGGEGARECILSEMVHECYDDPCELSHTESLRFVSQTVLVAEATGRYLSTDQRSFLDCISVLRMAMRDVLWSINYMEGDILFSDGPWVGADAGSYWGELAAIVNCAEAEVAAEEARVSNSVQLNTLIPVELSSIISRYATTNDEISSTYHVSGAGREGRKSKHGSGHVGSMVGSFGLLCGVSYFTHLGTDEMEEACAMLGNSFLVRAGTLHPADV